MPALSTNVRFQGNPEDICSGRVLPSLAHQRSDAASAGGPHIQEEQTRFPPLSSSQFWPRAASAVSNTRCHPRRVKGVGRILGGAPKLVSIDSDQRRRVKRHTILVFEHCPIGRANMTRNAKLLG